MPNNNLLTNKLPLPSGLSKRRNRRNTSRLSNSRRTHKSIGRVESLNERTNSTHPLLRPGINNNNINNNGTVHNIENNRKNNRKNKSKKNKKKPENKITNSNLNRLHDRQSVLLALDILKNKGKNFNY